MLPVCPRCDLALCIGEIDNIEIDYCAQCRGVWLDAGELESLCTAAGSNDVDPLRTAIAHEAAARRDRRARCPRCDRGMEIVVLPKTHGAIELDRCRTGHGVWFDGKELPQLLTHIATQGPRTSVAALAEMIRGLG